MPFIPAKPHRNPTSQKQYGGPAQDASGRQAIRRGNGWLRHHHMNGADGGAGLDVLKGCQDAPVGRDRH